MYLDVIKAVVQEESMKPSQTPKPSETVPSQPPKSRLKPQKKTPKSYLKLSIISLLMACA